MQILGLELTPGTGMLCSDCTDVHSETSFTLAQYFPEENPLFSKLLKQQQQTSPPKTPQNPSNQLAQGGICDAIFVSTLKLSINLKPLKNAFKGKATST